MVLSASELNPYSALLALRRVNQDFRHLGMRGDSEIWSSQDLGCQVCCLSSGTYTILANVRH